MTAYRTGIYSSVQVRIQNIDPNSIYIHCAAHNLNLVMNDAVGGIKRNQKFFDIIHVYSFFALSIK